MKFCLYSHSLRRFCSCWQGVRVAETLRLEIQILLRLFSNFCAYVKRDPIFWLVLKDECCKIFQSRPKISLVSLIHSTFSSLYLLSISGKMILIECLKLFCEHVLWWEVFRNGFRTHITESYLACVEKLIGFMKNHIWRKETWNLIHRNWIKTQPWQCLFKNTIPVL